MQKKWITLPPPPEEFINSHPELPTIISRLLMEPKYTHSKTD
jgi:hypothetical protein